MSSRALQIRDAVVALLTTPPLTGIGAGGVSVDPDYAFAITDLPAVAVYLGDEQAPDRSLIGALDHRLTVTVRVISGGGDAFATGDAVLVQCFNRIMTDLTLGGMALDMTQQGTRRTRDLLEKPVAVTEMDFAADYRTATTSLEV
ncbi:MAG: hypothetical protein AB1513_11460 [Pseudomonadota bacterium]